MSDNYGAASLGVAHEFEQGREHCLDSWCCGDQCIAQTGQDSDFRRDSAPGVDERLECAKHFATSHFDGADLGNQILLPVTSRGFEVDNAERDVTQWAPEFVE